MSKIAFNTSSLKLCAFVMAFVTPIAGALILMVSLIKSILFLSPKTDFGPVNLNSLIICSVTGVILIISGFILLVGLIKEKARWIFVYLVLSTPSLAYLMNEVVSITFLEIHFKVLMILFTAFMLCDQLCVLGFFILILGKKRTESMENLITYYEEGCFSTAVSRDHSFDSISF